MSKLKTIVALDYDGTITRDPDMWYDVMNIMQRHGHEVHIVTMRYDTESRTGGEPMDDRFLRFADGVHFTGNTETGDRHAKKPHMDGKGINVHVWIDDNPKAVHMNASEIWGWSLPAGWVASPVGKKCSVCGESQFTTSSGDTCMNGHGGAEAA